MAVDWREVRHWAGIWAASLYGLAVLAMVGLGFTGVPLPLAVLLPLGLVGFCIWLSERHTHR